MPVSKSRGTKRAEPTPKRTQTPLPQEEEHYDETRTRTIVGLSGGRILVWPAGEPTWQLPDFYDDEDAAATAVAKLMWRGVRELVGVHPSCDDPAKYGRPNFNADGMATLTLKKFRKIVRRAKYFHHDPDAPAQPTKIGEFAVFVEDQDGNPLPQYECRGDIIDSEEHRATAAELLHEAYHCALAWQERGAAEDLQTLRERALGAYLVSEHVKGNPEKLAAVAYAMSQLHERPSFIVKATILGTPDSDGWLSCWHVSDLEADDASGAVHLS